MIAAETAIRAQLRQGEFVAAYANAAAHFCRNPADQAAGVLLIDAAHCVERLEGAAAWLADMRPHIPARTFNLLNLQLHIFTGDSERIRQYWEAADLAPGSLIYHELAYRIALQRHDLPEALAQLDAMETLGGRPLAHFFAKFDILKKQGRYDAISAIIPQLLPQIAPVDRAARRQLVLAQAMVAHDELRFQDSIEICQAVIGEYLAAPEAKQPQPPAPAKPWTRRTQHQVLADLERLILRHNLPLCLAAGSLLALVREGDFFLHDKDVDLAILDADLKTITPLLTANGCFDAIAPPGYFVGFEVLRHRSSGFTVDLTQYQRQGSNRIARWRHPGGQILREAIYPDFGIVHWDHPTFRCRIPIPDDTERYLASMYGDWRTPDSGFDTVIAAHNLTGLTDFLLSMAYFRIANALCVGAYALAQSLVRHLQHRGVQSQLFPAIHALP